MVRNMTTTLRALNEVLVAARNMALENPGTPALLDIVDSVEAIPLWIADAKTDRSEDIIQLLSGLASQYPDCGIAARTALRLRDES